MIKLIEGSGTTSNNQVLYSDTKAEVPATGAETDVANWPGGTILPGSVLYTAALEIAVLNSDDQWIWGE